MPVIREKRFLRVKLDMVTRCQLRCVMCHFAHPDFKESPVTMGGELLEKVASALAVLSFEPNISVSKPENLDTATGVE